MLDVRNAISGILDKYTLADVVEITLRKRQRDSIPLPFSPEAARTAATRRGRRSGRVALASPSEGILHHILGEYSI